MKENIKNSKAGQKSFNSFVREIFIPAFLLLLVLFAPGCTTPPGKTKAGRIDNAATLKDKWGIQVIGIRETAAGYMLDFRYRVLDPEKALPLFKRQTKPYLIDQATGARLAVPNPPKVGPLRTSNKPQANRNYFIFFSNPGKFVKAGNKVTVVIGNARIEDIVVE